MARPKPKKSQSTKDIEAAFARVRDAVILRAKQTGTSIVVWRDGKVRDVSPEELEREEDSKVLPAGKQKRRSSSPRKGKRSTST